MRLVLQALDSAVLLLAKQDRPSNEPRTGGLHVDHKLVEFVVDKLLGTLPRVEGRDDIDLIAALPSKYAEHTITVQDERGQRHKVDIAVTRSKKYAGSLSFRHGGREANEATLFLNLPSALTRDSIPVDELRELWTSSLTHELAHARDSNVWHKAGGTGFGRSENIAEDRQRRAQYIADPRETIAHIAQVVAELQTKKAFDKLYVDASDPSFRLDPLTWAEQSSETWDSIHNLVNGTLKKRFIKAIANVYEIMLERKLKQMKVSGRALMAGIIAFPPKMAASIIERIEKELVSFYLPIAQDEAEAAAKALALFDGKLDENDIVAPKLSKQARELLRDFAYNLVNAELEDVDKLTGRWSNVPSLSDLINKTLPHIAGGGVKDLGELDLPTLKVVQNLFREAAVASAVGGVIQYDRKVAKSAWQDVSVYATKRSAAANQNVKAPGSLTLAELKIRNKLEDEATATELRANFYESFGVKAKKALHRVWEVPIDVTGLPPSYPLEAAENAGSITIDLFITKLNKKFGGRWFDQTKKMELIAQNTGIAPSRKEFAALKNAITSTIEHELRHMVQYLMQSSMQTKKWRAAGRDPKVVVPPSAVERVGTAFPPSLPIPKREGNAAERNAYPNAKSKKGDQRGELYYLDPIEFYPQIGSWVDRFYAHQDLADFKGSEKLLADAWKAYVGLPSTMKITIAPFYAALKNNDKRLWRKAVAEGWKLLNKKLGR